MQAGSVVAGRFVVDSLQGAGGMGEVYLARDQQTGRAVALKLLRSSAPSAAERFEREAQILARIEHPAVTAYVAHGSTEDGELYLAMEWIEGETLAARLTRGALSVDDSLALAGRIGAALGVLHGRGVIHRDLKPGNIILRERELSDPVLVDFGVARGLGDARLTATGWILGTPGYMAPEQARGLPSIDARADVFSLGAILFRCLAGRDAFIGEDALAVLTKIALASAPDVRELAPHVPARVAELLSRMMAREREERVEDGVHVARLIASLGDAEGAEPERPALMQQERSARSLLVAQRGVLAPQHGNTVEQGRTAGRNEQAIAEQHGGEVIELRQGAVVVTFSRRPGDTGVATDFAVSAGRCAIELAAALPRSVVAIVSGRDAGDRADKLEAMLDRAAALVALGTRRVLRVVADDVSASLFAGRFETEPLDHGVVVLAERTALDAPRLLLGRAVPCIGRDFELATLTAAYASAVSESTGRAIYIVGEAGIGKSRLASELSARLAHDPSPPTPWVVRIDGPTGRTARGALMHLVCERVHTRPNDARETRRAALDRYLPALGAGPGEEAVETLRELVAGPLDDSEASPSLRAARRDPQVMHERMRRAFGALVVAECARRPVAVIVDDAHTCDKPSLDVLAAAIDAARESPLLLVLLGRPELEARWRAIDKAGAAHPVVLTKLGDRASAAIVRAALGEDADDSIVGSVVSRAHGNAFFLEELLRSRERDQVDTVPESVLALASARLAALPAEHRRVLRAASVFGTVFWQAGVETIAGDSITGFRVSDLLAELVEREVIVTRETARFAGESELEFAHTLLRDAAHAGIAEADLAPAHLLAGRWLVRVGEKSARVLAEHAEKGGDRRTAAAHYRQGARDALFATDVDLALELVSRALACTIGDAAGSGQATVVGEVDMDAELGELHALRARALSWKGAKAEALEAGRTALDLVPVGSATWLEAAADAVDAACKQSELDRAREIARTLLTRVPSATPGTGLRIALARVCASLLYAGESDLGRELLARIAVAETTSPTKDPYVLAHEASARGFAAFEAAEWELAVEAYAAAAREYELAGILRSACLHRSNVAYALVRLGAAPEALVFASDALARSHAVKIESVTAQIRLNVALALSRNGKSAEALAEIERATPAIASVPYFMCAVHLGRAEIFFSTESWADAAREARAAYEIDRSPTGTRAYALALAARAAVRLGDPERALRDAREATALLTSLRWDEGFGPAVWLALSEAIDATGDRKAALDVLLQARDLLYREAARVRDPRTRATFLTAVPDHARISALLVLWEAEP